jgi:hypothetical protein
MLLSFFAGWTGEVQLHVSKNWKRMSGPPQEISQEFLKV